MQLKRRAWHYLKQHWRWVGIATILLLAFLLAIAWYQPWRVWESENLIQKLQSPEPYQRQEAFNELSSWTMMQRQPLLKQFQSTLISSYEQAINTALMKGEWRNAQLWLQDLQRLYPELPAVPTEQLKVSSYLAQQINVQITGINQILSTYRFLTPSTLQDITIYETQLKELSPDNALLYDKRILYALVFSIDEALAEHDFKLADQLLNWGMEHYPNQPELKDRQVQVSHQLAGRPAEVLATCISEGQSCWDITSFPPLFSYPWLIQNSAEYPWLADWNMSAIVQFELGSYYRREALQSYAQQQFMQTSVDLLKASYFNSPAELSEYWQWLAYAFIEREQKEYKAAQQAELSALQHTLLTQVAALDLVGAQNTVVTMQTMGADPWFIDQVALPMLGEAYLKVGQQLADSEQYELAMQLLVTGEEFLPNDPGIKGLLTEYKEVMPYHAANYLVQTNLGQSQAEVDAGLWDAAAIQALGFDKPTLSPAANSVNNNTACTAIFSSGSNGVHTCQDQLSSHAKGPLLIVPPASAQFASSYAIGKYPISIREYNYYCHITKACEAKRLPSTQKANLKEKSRKNTPANSSLDLSDVQVAKQDYDDYCKSTGTCSSTDPNAQDYPVTDITLAEAAAYMNWLSKTTKQTYRLPTETEWRYAILSNEIYRCTSDTLLKLPQKLKPVQQGSINRWGIAHELGILQEWVQTPRNIGTMGPEHADNPPVCSLPLETSEESREPSQHKGFRVLREM